MMAIVLLSEPDRDERPEKLGCAQGTWHIPNNLREAGSDAVVRRLTAGTTEDVTTFWTVHYAGLRKRKPASCLCKDNGGSDVWGPRLPSRRLCTV